MVRLRFACGPCCGCLEVALDLPEISAPKPQGLHVSSSWMRSQWGTPTPVVVPMSLYPCIYIWVQIYVIINYTRTCMEM